MTDNKLAPTTMPLTISFRGLASSAPLETLVHKQAAVLERIYPRIASCRVVLEVPHRRAGAQLHVRIELHVPDHEIVVQRPASANAPPVESSMTVRAAFRAAELRLHEYADRRQAVRE